MTKTPKMNTREGTIYTLPYVAELLKVSRQGLYYLLHKYEIRPYQAKRNPRKQQRPTLYLMERQLTKLQKGIAENGHDNIESDSTPLPHPENTPVINEDDEL